MSLDELLSHRAWLQKFAERVARNHALADDLVQETWLVALQWQSSGQELARPWLARVLRNLARMRARGEERRKQRELAFVDADSSVQSPEALVYQGQAQQMLTKHVLALDEPYRSTRVLHYVDGLSASEIAARLDVPAGTGALAAQVCAGAAARILAAGRASSSVRAPSSAACAGPHSPALGRLIGRRSNRWPYQRLARQAAGRQPPAELRAGDHRSLLDCRDHLAARLAEPSTTGERSAPRRSAIVCRFVAANQSGSPG
jgi:RNA polymerase sigma factor (sigma-70 family)